VLGVRDAVHYEGQAAVELEQRVDPHERGGYPMRVSDGPPLVLYGTDLLRVAVTDLRAAVPVPVIAARFHRGLAAGVAAAVARVRAETGLETVALSGGVFQNVVLLAELTGLLAADGFTVLTHTRVPPNDGGISLGQAAVAAARDAGPAD
jgi:hydrogenase maturation protein HypF